VSLQSAVPANGSAVCCQTRRWGPPVRSLTGIKRLERNYLRLQLLHLPDVFTRELVLGMPCSALKPTSKPGRPRILCVRLFDSFIIE
jgi:hypothetical protein